MPSEIDAEKLCKWLNELINDLNNREISSAKVNAYIAAELFNSKKKTVSMILECIKDGSYKE